MSVMVTSFHYRASDQQGRIESGRVEADSRRAAADQLALRGLLPIRITEQSPLRATVRPIPVAELALGLRILADLLESGLPMSRAVIALEAAASRGWKSVLPGIHSAVREGKSFARALEESKLAVPGEVVGILYAGERGAGLSGALRSAAEICQQNADTRAAIRGALAYPMLLASAGTASAALLVTVVLPRFAAILSDMGQTLPASTRLVLAASVMLHVAAVPGLFFAVGVAFVWRAYTRTLRGRERWHAALLVAPVLGETRWTAATSRLCTTLGAMLEAGVPIATALPFAARASGDAAVITRAAAARELVVQGEPLSRALATHHVVTAVAIRLIHAGEESGRIASLLAHAGRLERDRATRRVQSLVRVIEPALIIGFGGVVAFVAASLLQALYSVRPGT